MANEKNLTHKLTVEEARKGGRNSVKSKKQKKTVRKILDDYLSEQVGDVQAFKKIALKLGISNDKSVKDLFTVVCLMNTLKEGNLGDLEKLVRLLGEDEQNENKDVIEKLDDVLKKIGGNI